MHRCISIWGCVRPSVCPSVGRSVGPSPVIFKRVLGASCAVYPALFERFKKPHYVDWGTLNDSMRVLILFERLSICAPHRGSFRLNARNGATIAQVLKLTWKFYCLFDLGAKGEIVGKSKESNFVSDVSWILQLSGTRKPRHRQYSSQFHVSWLQYHYV